jgi:hypothetical protein
MTSRRIGWFAAVEVHGIVLCRLNNLKIHSAFQNCSVWKNRSRDDVLGERGILKGSRSYRRRVDGHNFAPMAQSQNPQAVN